jgi:hypothetical protein
LILVNPNQLPNTVFNEFDPVQWVGPPFQQAPKSTRPQLAAAVATPWLNDQIHKLVLHTIFFKV